MNSCLNVRFPLMSSTPSVLYRAGRDLPWSGVADRIQAFSKRGEVKDFFKFWSRLSDFMGLAHLRDYFPDLPSITVYTKRFDYFDVFVKKYPRFKSAAKEAWAQGAITRKLLNHTIDFGGGVIKLTARFFPKDSLIGRLGLPITALTALTFAREQLVYEAPAIASKELAFTAEVAKEYISKVKSGEDREALFNEIKGAYNERAAELLISTRESLISDAKLDKLARHVRDQLKKERYLKLSEGAHSLASGGILAYATIAGMGAVSSGALLTFMFTPYIARYVIDRSTQIEKFLPSKEA